MFYYISKTQHIQSTEKYVKTTYTDIPDSIRYLYSNEAEVTKELLQIDFSNQMNITL